jgi:hypothetical protein
MQHPEVLERRQVRFYEDIREGGKGWMQQDIQTGLLTWLDAGINDSRIVSNIGDVQRIGTWREVLEVK